MIVLNKANVNVCLVVEPHLVGIKTSRLWHFLERRWKKRSRKAMDYAGRPPDGGLNESKGCVVWQTRMSKQVFPVDGISGA